MICFCCLMNFFDLMRTNQVFPGLFLLFFWPKYHFIGLWQCFWDSFRSFQLEDQETFPQQHSPEVVLPHYFQLLFFHTSKTPLFISFYHFIFCDYARRPLSLVQKIQELSYSNIFLWALVYVRPFWMLFLCNFSSLCAFQALRSPPSYISSYIRWSYAKRWWDGLENTVSFLLRNRKIL